MSVYKLVTSEKTYLMRLTIKEIIRSIENNDGEEAKKLGGLLKKLMKGD